MRLKEACEFAEACGLKTVGEAITNIELHSPSLFGWNQIGRELRELYEDCERLQIDDDTAIEKILGQRGD